jgi:citrate lyase synthetase
MKSFKQFFTEQQENKFVVMLPGGYKPPTKGHMYMIESYNNLPLVAKVIVLIGPKEREGITREQALKIFELYGIDKLQKVTLEDTKFDNPMQAAFDYVENDPRAEEFKGLTFAIGASDKGDDAARAERLVKYFTAKPEKLRDGFKVGIPPIIKALQTDGVDVSATDLRTAIQNRDIKTIQNLIPNNITAEDFLQVFNK